MQKTPKLEIEETKQFRYTTLDICDERGFTVHRRHKGHGLDAGEVYTARYNPVSLRETPTYLPIALVPTSGHGLAIVTRVDKFKGREEYVVLHDDVEEVFEVRQLADNRVDHLKALARQAAATAPAPGKPKRSRSKASV